MLTIYQLMKYLRNHHSITVKGNQAQALRNIGYYHGFKGYRLSEIQASAFLSQVWMKLLL